MTTHSSARAGFVYVLIFILLALSMIVSGYLYYHNFEQQYRVQAGNQISAIAKLKADELVDWRRERLGDAKILYRNPSFSALVERYFRNPEDVEARTELVTWFENYQAYDHYDGVHLLDAAGADRLSVPAAEKINENLLSDAAASLRSGEIVFLDFQHDTSVGGDIRIFILIPIFAGPNNDRPLGVLALSINPQLYLYPYIQSWPALSTSAETLLVRRDGDEVLFLNELRFAPDAALTLRYPLTDTNTPAVMAVLGQSGVVQGIDYRGESVLADVRPVPDSPWFLVSKMDTSEIYAPLRERLLQTFGLIGMAIFVAGAGLLTVWRQQRVQFYRTQAETAEELRESEERFRLAVIGAPFPIMIHAEDGEVVTVNTPWTKFTGYAQQDIPTISEWIRKAYGTRKNPAQANIEKMFSLDEPKAEGEYTIMTRSGEARIWDFNSVPIGHMPDGRRLAISIATDVTERKRVEEALRESEERFKTMFMQAPLGIALIGSLTGHIYEANPRFAGIAGMSMEEITSIDWMQITHPDDVQADLDNMALLNAGKINGFQMEKRYVHPDGTIVWINMTVTPLMVQNSAQPLHLCMIEDITEHKRAQDALQSSEANLRKAQQHAHVGSWTWNIKTNQLKWSDEMYHIFGIEKESFTGDLADVVASAIHPEDRGKVERSNQSVSEQGKPVPLEYRVVLADGTIRVVWGEAGEMVLDEDGKPSYLSGIVQDITVRKLSEEKDRAQAVALETAANGIVITDKNGTIEWINPAWSALTGYSKDEVIGQNPRILKSGIQDHAYYKNLWDTILSGKAWRGELVNRRKDGTFYTEEETITPVLDENGAIKNFIAIKQDITLRRQAERILQARLRLNSYSLNSEMDAFLQKALDEAEALTESQIGFFHFVESDQKNLTLQAWSTNTLTNMCNAEGKGLQYPVDIAGIWAETIRDQLPHIYNDYPGALNRKGMPEGHAQVTRFITVPLIKNDKVVAVLGVGNKATPYSQPDLDLLAQLVSDTWDVVLRKVTENALARSNQRLQSLRRIDHALLGANKDDESTEMAALHHLVELVPCDRINIIALDEISGSALVIARVADEKLTASPIDESVSSGDLRLKELEHREILLATLEDGKLNPYEKRLYDAGGRSLVKAPLSVQGKLIGLLVMSSANPDFFAAEYLEIIKDVSTQLAVSMHQENLLKEIRRHVDKLEQRVAERTAEIESAHRRLELATRAGEIGVWELNLKDNKVLWDDRMHLIHGTQPADFGNSVDEWWRMIHPQDVTRTRMLFEEALHLTGLFNDEHRVLRPDGNLRYVAANAIVIYNEEREPQRMIGVNVDVTERVQAEEILRLANAEMKRALRVKDEFLANMSHELRTPLNAVMGISESLLEQNIGVLNEKQQKYISTINESGEHLLALINDILDLSKIEAGRLELNITEVPIKPLLESSFRMVKEMAQKKNIVITLSADEQVQNIPGDERRLKQMLVNLLSNAVKFTPMGGRAGVEVAAHPESNQVTFTVWDSGIGILESDMPRLFQSFVQLDSSLSREYSGTGLGLMLVMQMVRMHGGNISVQSKLNQGSRFTISLPWMPSDTEVSAEKMIEEAAPSLLSGKKRTGRILLIEDTESVIMLLQDYLQGFGHQVLTARDGLSGVEMAKSEYPDLILMDIQIPGMDGFEAAEQLRAYESLRSVPIIALTALAMPGDRERCFEAGMNEYVSKPIRLNELKKIIEGHLK